MIYYCRGKQLQLQGFNNLTKSLSLNVYKVFFVPRAGYEQKFYEQMDKHFNSKRLSNISREMAERIQANIISVSQHDFDPRGASALTLISEAHDILQATTVAHLDKSHISIHTYPEFESDSTIATIRLDIDVATCGLISPVSVLDYLFKTFRPVVAHADYRIRGFTRDAQGAKHFIDHDIDSIQNFISSPILKKYAASDFNLADNNVFHTRLLLKEAEPGEAILGQGTAGDPQYPQEEMLRVVMAEARSIYASRDEAG